MNKNALKSQSKIKVSKTVTGKLPDSFGFDGRGGGVIRSLTRAELMQQKRLGLVVSSKKS